MDWHDELLNNKSFYRDKFFNRNNIGLFINAVQQNAHLESLVLERCGLNEVNGFSLLSEAIRTHPSLKSLKITIDRFYHRDAQALAVVLRDNPVLEVLNLKDNQIAPPAVVELADALQKNTNLKVLNLSMNKIGVAGTQALANALRANISLQSLNLSSTNICSENIQILEEALRGNTNLKVLDISSNNLGPEGVSALADILRTNTGLQSLNLSHTIYPGDIQRLEEALQSNVNLKTLNLSSCEFSPEDIHALANVLQTNTSLQSLDLSYTNIGSEGIQLLAEALQKNTTLKTLAFEHNKIGSEGACALANVVQANTGLQSLEFQHDGIGLEGVCALANALPLNTRLQHLKINYDDIGLKGACALAEGLRKNTGLQHLELYDSHIGSDGACALIEGLQANTSLESLSLWDKTVGSKGAHALFKFLRENASLQSLSLGYDTIGLERFDEFVKALQYNCNLTEISGVLSDELIILLDRNKVICAVLDSFYERGELDHEEIIKSLKPLECLLPDIADSEHYRLLCALTYLVNAQNNAVLTYLQAPFKNKKLQKISDKAFCQALMVSDFFKASPLIQTIRYQLLAYVYQDDKASVEYRVAVLSLKYPDETISPDRLNEELTEEDHILYDITSENVLQFKQILGTYAAITSDEQIDIHISSAQDFKRIMKYLLPEERKEVFNRFRDIIPELIIPRDPQATFEFLHHIIGQFIQHAWSFLGFLQPQSPEKQAIAFNDEGIENFIDIITYLLPEQAALVYESLIKQLPDDFSLKEALQAHLSENAYHDLLEKNLSAISEFRQNREGTSSAP